MASIQGPGLKHDVRAVARQFQIEGEFLSAQAYGSGHINDTYCAVFAGGRRVVFQRVNHSIFKDPAALMENIERVTAHVRAKLAGKSDAARRVLTLIPARDGRSCFNDELGNTWRATPFIEGTRTRDTVQSPGEALEGAKTFGRFQKMLADLPAPRLHDTIPDFHSLPKRFAALERAIAADGAGRAALAGPEIEFALRHQELTRALEGVSLPERVTHNDTKISNVLFDEETGEGICVIDLDTVMPGLTIYDFGDMARTMTSTADEDERDLSRVAMQFPMFEGVARGYVTATAEFLTAEEKECLAISGTLITYEMGMRFLADFLEGDAYFKVRRAGHNLDRCRTQFKLMESMVAQRERMESLIESLG